MLNFFDKYIVYLDPETLKYMFLNYSGARKYPVMTKLFNLLRESYLNNQVVTPISFEQIQPFIVDKKIELDFINMMGELGQIKFNQRFTIRTLQFIRIINSFFVQNFRKPMWKDAFSHDPDEKYQTGFNTYQAFTVQAVANAIEREKNNSMIYYFLKSFRDGKSVDEIAGLYYSMLWERFPDVITPFLPMDGTPEHHIKRFIQNDDIKEIPEYHIISNLLFPIFETYGIDKVETGSQDDLLIASEVSAAYLPYCHFFVSTADVAELIMMTGINSQYNAFVYDNNESSLYKLISDLTNAIKTKKATLADKNLTSMFKRRL
jgi:hypothetical protein